MKGAVAIFLMTVENLPMTAAVDSFYYLPNRVINLLIGQNFLCGIHKKHIQTALDGKVVLLFSVRFSYSPLQQVALYSALEKLFRY